MAPGQNSPYRNWCRFAARRQELPYREWCCAERARLQHFPYREWSRFERARLQGVPHVARLKTRALAPEVRCRVQTQRSQTSRDNPPLAHTNAFAPDSAECKPDERDNRSRREYDDPKIPFAK